jgi:Xaa-Pro aminopeptidase
MMKISKREFPRRRKELMGQLEEQSIVIVPAALHQLRNRDVEYPFRQDSDFFYLSGFDEPEAVLVLVPGRKQGQSILFCRERDVAKELWNGRRSGTEGACADYGFDDAFPITDIDDILPGLIEGRRRVYYAMGKMPEFDRKMMAWVNTLRANTRSGAHPPGEFVDLDHLLHEMRLIKRAPEIKLMRRAAEISARAHIRAMRACRAGVYEYQLEAELMHEFNHSGCQGWAYQSIVGGGDNACILHYTDNTDRLRDGDLVLIDAGCELNYYAADITRTFPVSGRFSKPQRQLYEVCLAAQMAALACIKPGVSWNEPHIEAVRVITEGLVELGLLRGQVSRLIDKAAYQRFYMHRTGHWLGMDVHDVGDYKIDDQWRLLEPGMVLTVEPGIYIAPDDHKVARKWRGIGIRIEDDVLVTERGCEVLSRDVPKEVDQIEALMAGASVSP